MEHLIIFHLVGFAHLLLNMFDLFRELFLLSLDLLVVCSNRSSCVCELTVQLLKFPFDSRELFFFPFPVLDSMVGFLLFASEEILVTLGFCETHSRHIDTLAAMVRCCFGSAE